MKNKIICGNEINKDLLIYYELHKNIKCTKCPFYKNNQKNSCNGSNNEIENLCTWSSKNGLLERSVNKRMEQRIDEMKRNASYTMS